MMVFIDRQFDGNKSTYKRWNPELPFRRNTDGIIYGYFHSMEHLRSAFSIAFPDEAWEGMKEELKQFGTTTIVRREAFKLR